MAKAGRPSRYSPVFVELAKNMRKLNLPVEVIAATFGVDARTTWEWRKKYPKFHRSMKVVNRSPHDFIMGRG